MDILESEVANFRVVHAWARLTRRGDLAGRLSAALAWFAFWRMRVEAFSWAEPLAQLPEACLSREAALRESASVTGAIHPALAAAPRGAKALPEGMLVGDCPAMHRTECQVIPAVGEGLVTYRPPSRFSLDVLGAPLGLGDPATACVDRFDGRVHAPGDLGRSPEAPEQMRTDFGERGHRP